MPKCCIWNLTEFGPAVWEEKLFENVDKHSIPITLDQGHWMTLTYGIHTFSWSTYFHIKDYHCFGKMQFLTFSPCQILKDQILLWRKMGQGQSRITIWTNLVELGNFVLHTKFKGNQSRSSGEEDFLRFLPYMSMAQFISHRSQAIFCDFEWL